jgi:hypothetical protein
MLIPRFTLRWLLLLTTFCGFFFFIVAFAARGQAWAVAVTLAGVGLVAAFLCYGVFFGLAYIIASLIGLTRSPVPGGTPFATAEPPPQLLPPEEPE